MWKICRHRAILLHGPAAAVLQIAHPRIGLGVMEHSDFEDAPLDRLERTLNTTYAIAFGTYDEANTAARDVANRHARVAGSAEAHQVPGPARYSVNEPDLLLWVLATLVWSAVTGYERTVGPLSPQEKNDFYRDMRTLGTFFNLPQAFGPQTYADFETYFAAQLQDPLLGSHAVSRKVASAVARPRTPLWFRISAYPITFMFSEIIPPPVRDRLGFKSTLVSRLSLRIATFTLRLFSTVAPGFLKHVPQYRQAKSACHSHAARHNLRFTDVRSTQGGGTCESSHS